MKEKKSFTSIVKEEICSMEFDSIERLRALLAAFIRINGSIVIHNRKTMLTLKTENAKIGKFLYTTINKIYDAHANLNMFTKSNLGKKSVYTVEIKEASETILEDLDVSFLEGKISKNIVKNDDTISGYLAGAFLAAGSVNSPETSNYHLELSLNNENFAKWLSRLFAKYTFSNIEPKIIKRRENYVIYFKKSDQISNFLVMIGAVESCLDFENVRANRDLMNSANRLTNMDTANMKKQVDAGAKQVSEIKVIDKYLGIENIQNPKIKLLCQIRLENESASLLELARIMSERLERPVTKSNVNHLFRAIHQLYEKLK